jgi:SHS2 domain-containing protein
MVADAHAGFEIFAVTADKGIRAWGRTPAEAFRHAARALWSLMVDATTVKGKDRFAVTVEGGDREALLVAWLNELLYLYEVKEIVGADCTILSLTDTRLDAAVWGESLDGTRHVTLSHVKAVTYHQLHVVPMEDGWEARVVVDV